MPPIATLILILMLPFALGAQIYIVGYLYYTFPQFVQKRHLNRKEKLALLPPHLRKLGPISFTGLIISWLLLALVYLVNPN